MSNDKKQSEDKDPLLLDHEYDGIQELDNPLPNWWLVTFYGAIIFSFFYWIHYHGGGFGLSSTDALNKHLSEINEAQSEAMTKATSVTEDELLALLEDTEALNEGKVEYMGKCASCHGDKGQGLIGPNLTDKYWLHGEGTIKDVANVISVGVASKGMPPWKGLISGPLMNKVAAYIVSLKGTQPEGAKKAEGELVE
jgi:cytochrome c oxidase cbb3-type subunit 3